MKNVKIKLANFPSFEIIEKDLCDLHTLAFFLITEIDEIYKLSPYKDWVSFLNQDVITGSCYQLIKYRNNIYISTIFDDFELDQYDNSLPTGVEYEFKISVDDFIKVLDEWGKIVALDPRPKEVIIKQDDIGKISFETIF